MIFEDALKIAIEKEKISTQELKWKMPSFFQSR